MSRNFDLLAEVERERESDARNNHGAVVTGHPVAKEFIPADSGGLEMLRLVQTVFLSTNGAAPRQVVFCGVDDENGSSAVCAKAAWTLAAASSKPVCLIDANSRAQHLSRLLRLENTIPFTGKSPSVREECVQIGSNLWFAGTSLLSDNHGVLLPADELKRRMTQMDTAFEYVLIDAPGAGVCGDAAILGQVAESAILVVEANRTRRFKVARAKESFDSAGVQLLGTVLHNRSFPIPEKLYRRL